MSTTTTHSYIIHIPAKEFSHSAVPLPLRLVQPPQQPTHTRSCVVRQQLAAANRAAKLHSTRLRCHRHITHVAQVANAVRQSRTHQVSERRRTLHTQLARAESRRSVLRIARSCVSPYHIAASTDISVPLSPSSVVCDDHAGMNLATLSTSLSKTISTNNDPSLILKANCLAANRLASYYLLSKARRILRTVGLLGPLLISASFEQLTNRIQANSALHASHLILRAVRFYSQTESTEQENPVKTSHCRILLSTVLMALHPDVITSASPESSVLHDRYVVACARRLVTILHVGDTAQIHAFWPTWVAVVRAWKARDAQTLLVPLIEKAVALDEKQTTVGQVLTAAADAAAVRDILQGETQNQTPKNERSQDNDEEVQWRRTVQAQQKSIREAAVLVAGANGGKQVDAARHSAALHRKEQLLHDVLVDAEGVVSRMCDATTVPDEAWTAVQKGLSSSPPQYDALAARLAFISRILNGLKANSFVIHPPPTNCGLSATYACNIVQSLVEACRKVQAPIFDEALREWSDSTIAHLRSVEPINLPSSITDALRDATVFIRLAHSQVITFRIRTAANAIAEYGPSIEREWFNRRVQDGEYHAELPRTVTWLREAASTLQIDRCHVFSVLAHGLRSLVICRKPCYPHKLPEILALDATRIFQMQNKVQKCCLAIALDGLGKEFLRCRNVNTATEGCGKAVWAVCSKAEYQNADLEECVIAWVRKQHAPLSINEESLLRAMVKRVVTEPDGVLRVATARLGEAITNECIRLFEEKRCDRRGATTEDSTTAILPCVRSDVKSIGRLMWKIATCLLDIHNDFIHTVMS